MKKILSIALVIVLTLSLTIPAIATQDKGKLTGDTTVATLVLQVTVPTNLPLALDPLAFNEDDTQVVQTPFKLANNTPEADVLAAFYLDLELEDGVALVAQDALEDRFKLDSDEKNIYLGVIAAADIEDGEVDFKDGVIVPFVEDTEIDISFGFILDAQVPAVGPTPAVPGEDAFAFYGEMEAYADWKAADVTVTGVYLLKAISTQTNVETVDGTIGLVDVAENALPSKPTFPADVVFTEPGTKAATVQRSAGSWTIQLPDPFPDAVDYFGGNSPWAEGTDWTYDEDTGIITTTRLPNGATATLRVEVDTDTYTIELTIVG